MVKFRMVNYAAWLWLTETYLWLVVVSLLRLMLLLLLLILNSTRTTVMRAVHHSDIQYCLGNNPSILLKMVELDN